MDLRELKSQIGAILGEVGNKVDSAAKQVRSVFNDDPFEILAYRGYGNATTGHVYGRVIEKPNVSVAVDTDPTWRNLLNTYRRAESDPLAHAQLKIDLGGRTSGCTTDDEGFFRGQLDADKPMEGEWEKYEVEIVGLSDAAPKVSGSGEILVPPSTARFCVVSDIDDTVIQSRVSNFLQAARTVMLGNARTRLPFPGVAGFYQALRNGSSGDEKNPIFYVSSSPWNIYDVISEFMDIQKIPKGPLVLRDWDIQLSALDSSRHAEHKGVAIRNLLQLYPAMRFILIGDTSQRDPEIYRHIVGEFPERVLAVYIRDVNLTAQRKASVDRLAAEVLEAGSTLILSDDTMAAARHSAEQGWIAADSLEHVDDEKRADEGKDDTKVPAPRSNE